MLLKIDIQKMFSEYVEQGWIKASKHPEFDLYIFNYTHQTQIKAHWDEYTLSSRGLITDLEGNIVARPFRKFFNYSEYRPQYDGPIDAEAFFRIMEKLDGSMGITYYYKGVWYMATRGAFESEQAIKGSVMLREFMEEYSSMTMHPEYTYIFEIIYPENQIVVDYKGESKLVLLGVITTKTGIEEPLSGVNPGFDVPALYDTHVPLDELHTEIKAKENFDNSEGFVVRFDNGFRLKLKFPAYCQLHKILSTLTRRNVLDYLREHEPVSKQVADAPLPEKCRQFIFETEKEFLEKHAEIIRQCSYDFLQIPKCPDGMNERKHNALYFQKCEYPGILFLILDNKPNSLIDDKVWSLMRKTLDKDEKIVV